MILKSSCLTALLVGLGLSVAGCADGYGYGGVDAGYGPGYAPGYGYAGGPYGSGYGYAPGYYGWYDNFYYPGAGRYVFDRDRRAYRWNGRQQRYWQDRRRSWYDQRRGQNGGGWRPGGRPRADWGGFAGPGAQPPGQPRPDGIRGPGGPRPHGQVRPDGGRYRPPAGLGPRPEGTRGPRGGMRSGRDRR